MTVTYMCEDTIGNKTGVVWWMLYDNKTIFMEGLVKLAGLDRIE